MKTHQLGFGSISYPAVNIKVYRTPGIDAARKALEARGVAPRVVERALEWAFNSACRNWWDGEPEYCADCHLVPCEGFSSDYRIDQEGRSGGWLVVTGLGEPLDWTPEQVAAWDAFEGAIHESIERALEKGSILEEIDSNRWAEEFAQEYNFIDTASGCVCMADVNRAKAEACAKIDRNFGI